ncbi:MAG: pentapeptide repeat-containing protein, partial [Cyanobacteriota bacterium]
MGATRFCGADLRGAFFSNAFLTRASFAASRQLATRLERACWKGARGLELARPGATLLAEPRCRQLLLSGSAPGADLHGLNLRGAYLPQADLRGADLRETNLSEAVLTEAHLEKANLKASQCLGTDMEGAHLTGATLEAWNINHATNLHAIDCAYVYLLEPFDALGQRRDDHHRERLPHDPDKSFGPGDFETYFKQLLEEVKLLIKNGVDAKAFQQAFQEVMRQHPQITPESITGLKKSGNDVLVTLQAPASVDKGAVEQTFFAKYNAVMLENARLKGLLDGERRVSEVERERATQFAELASRLVPAVHPTPHPTTVVNNTFHAGDGNLINTGTFHTGGGLVNLGALSDQARLTIEALPD